MRTLLASLICSAMEHFGMWPKPNENASLVFISLGLILCLAQDIKELWRKR